MEKLQPGQTVSLPCKVVEHCVDDGIVFLEVDAGLGQANPHLTLPVECLRKKPEAPTGE